jgi:predicted permease
MLFRDLVFAARTLRRSPVFTLAAALTIALGIGASTAIFTVANSVLLRPLPYKDPDRLVVMYMDLRVRNSLGMPLSNENFVDIREGSRGSFEDMAALRTGRQVLPGLDGTPEQVRFGVVTVNFFRMMGASVAFGRDFEDADGVPQPAPPTPQPGGAPAAQGPPPLPVVAILSYEYWQRRYGGDPAVLGQRIPGGPRPEIVGVLAPGFELLFPPGTNVEQRPDVWIANRLTYNNANRNTFGLRPIGRLKPGIALARAQEEADAVSAHIREQFPVSKGSGFHARLEPMHKTLVDEARPAILALMGAVIFLLLIACANVANLLLVRSSLRQPELAVRAALGADRGRVIRQMLAESVVLTVLGAAGGIALAWIGIRQLLSIAPANLPRLETIRIDPIVLLFTLVIALAAAFLFGMVPAWSALRMDLVNALGGAARTSGLRGGGRLFRNAVVVIEVALCFVLLVGSGLMIRSFLELQRIDPGYDPRGLLTFQLLGGGPVTNEQGAARGRQLEERLRAIPGVQSVTASFPFPLGGDFSTIRWGLEDALADTSKFQAVDWQVVRPGYFDTMRTPLVAGRTFTEADNNPKRNVVVVDTALAAKAFPNEPAVGKRILIRIRTPEPEWVEIIGVVRHQRVTSLADPGREQVYFADGFLGFGANRWAVRTGGDPAQIAGAVRAAVAEVNSQYLVTDLRPMGALVLQAQASTRFSLLLIGVLAVMAALLVAVGLYGVLSTVVRQRTAEIGVRMAVGAVPSQILRLVVGHGLRLSAAGVLLGLVAAIALTRAMTTMLVGVRPTDPLTFAAMVVLFFVIAIVSSWLPARRAAGLDPTMALREG